MDAIGMDGMTLRDRKITLFKDALNRRRNQRNLHANFSQRDINYPSDIHNIQAIMRSDKG